MLYRVAVVVATAFLVATSALAGSTSFGWALASKGCTAATSTDELSRLEQRTSDSDRILYARFGEDEYLIRDPATLDRADSLIEPIRQLGESAREIRPVNGADPTDKQTRQEWKERLRPFKEKRRELLLRVSPRIEALARDAVARGKAQRLPTSGRSTSV